MAGGGSHAAVWGAHADAAALAAARATRPGWRVSVGARGGSLCASHGRLQRHASWRRTTRLYRMHTRAGAAGCRLRAAGCTKVGAPARSRGVSPIAGTRPSLFVCQDGTAVLPRGRGRTGDGRRRRSGGGRGSGSRHGSRHVDCTHSGSLCAVLVLTRMYTRTQPYTTRPSCMQVRTHIRNQCQAYNRRMPIIDTRVCECGRVGLCAGVERRACASARV